MRLTGTGSVPASSPKDVDIRSLIFHWRHAQALWTNLGTRWGHKRDVLWTNLWVAKLIKFLAQNACAAWHCWHRHLPRRREAYPIQRATSGSIRRGNSPDHTSGQPPATLNRRGNPGGSSCGYEQRCLVRLRSGRRPSGRRKGWLSGRSTVHPRVDRRRPLQCLVGGAFVRLRTVCAKPAAISGSDTAGPARSVGTGTK